MASQNAEQLREDRQPQQDGQQQNANSRRVLVRAHLSRPAAKAAAIEVLERLVEAQITPVVLAEDVEESPLLLAAGAQRTLVVQDLEQAMPLELCLVLGGDGSILRAADIVRPFGTPLLGINTGHVGFLAESELADLKQAVRDVVEHNYTVEDRMALRIQVKEGSRTVHQDWALNEAAIEKENRGRMIEVMLGVDGEPVSSFGCDGICVSTPTGSTAYSFSAGGPVVWPEVEAMVITPIAAHALFARPLVVSPSSDISVQMLGRTDAEAVLWCDGRTSFDLSSTARILIRRDERPIRIARTTSTPFSQRLVRKFKLPIQGWRGPVEDPHAAEGAGA